MLMLSKISNQPAQQITCNNLILNVLYHRTRSLATVFSCLNSTVISCSISLGFAVVFVDMKKVETVGDLVNAPSSASSNFRLSGLVAPRRANRTGYLRASFSFGPCGALVPGGLAFAALLFLG